MVLKHLKYILKNVKNNGLNLLFSIKKTFILTFQKIFFQTLEKYFFEILK